MLYAREMATIDVQDTGPGLSADEISQIFEPFARGSSSAQAAPGAGLGLTMAKMLTDLMGGELTVSSTPGQGATFRVKLFLPEVHGGLAVARKPAPAQRRAYLGARRKVLVVDNEEPDRELLVQLLEPLGFELRQAASGHDALDLLATGYRPDVIFMDLAMPGIDGWETLRRVRQMHLEEVRSAPGRPKPDGAPSGGSDDTQCGAWGPSCPPCEFGGFTGVAAGCHLQQTGFLGLGNLQAADQAV